MLKRFVVGLSCAAALALQSGCFKSSTLQASWESSSDSSSPSDKESAYQRDIRDYTTAYAAKGGDLGRFRHDVSAIAAGHGVTDWEADPATLLAIGRGVRDAGVDSQRAQELAASLAAGDRTQMDWIRQGYQGRSQ